MQGGTELTNEELALRAQAGDRESIGQLWEQVKPLTFQFAGRFFSRSLSSCSAHGVTLDDLQQECFLAVTDALKAYDPDRGLKFNSYLNYPLKNHFNTLIGCRGNQRQEPLDTAASLDEPLQGTDDPDLTLMNALKDDSINIEESAEESDVQRIVRRAVNRLKPFLRFLIERVYFQGCTLEVLSQETTSDRNKIRKDHQKALDELRKTEEIKQLRQFYVSVHTARFYSEDPLEAVIWDW